MAITLLDTMSAAHAAGQSDLAKAAQNPIADLISLPLQNNTNFNVGPQKRTQNILRATGLALFDW
jgi:hypothetical protein